MDQGPRLTQQWVLGMYPPIQGCWSQQPVVSRAVGDGRDLWGRAPSSRVLAGSTVNTGHHQACVWVRGQGWAGTQGSWGSSQGGCDSDTPKVTPEDWAVLVWSVP